MTKLFLAAGIAALAISTPATADRGGHGGQGGGHEAKAQKGGGHEAKVKQGGGNKDVEMKSDRGHGKALAQVERGHGQSAEHKARVAERGRSDDHIKIKGNERAVIVRDRDVVRTRDVVRSRDWDDNDRWDRWDSGRALGFHDGCPPGLWKKDNGCLPPGQAKKLLGTRLSRSLTNSLLPLTYRSWYRDDDDFLYRADNGYIYRIDRDNGLINGLIPLVDRDFAYYPVGMAYPADYNFYNVPYQYQRFYPDGGDYYYRYGDGAIYQVSPQTGLIQGIAALLAGDLGVGQPLPLGYSAYNVPLAYRDRYYDTADNWYRYNDGYIYRVDPTTQLITAVISALI